MSTASHYEINVSKDGRHYFATAPRSLMTYNDAIAIAMAKDFAVRFPASEGFKIRVTFWDCSGKHIDFAGDES